MSDTDDKTSNETHTEKHILETGFGIGRPPYRYLGMSELRQNASGSYVSTGPFLGALGSCHHCGTGIRYHFWVCNADGQTHALGSDCIAKIHWAPKIKKVLDKAVADHRRELARARRETKRELAQQGVSARFAEYTALFAAKRAQLEGQPHPNQDMARRGLSLADYIAWCLERRASEAAIKEILTQKTPSQAVLSQKPVSSGDPELDRVRDEIRAAGNVAQFVGLYEGTRRVAAKKIETKYGMAWRLDDAEAQKFGRQFIPTGDNSRVQKKLGLREAQETAPAWAVISHERSGFSYRAFVAVFRTGDKLGLDAKLVEPA